MMKVVSWQEIEKKLNEEAKKFLMEAYGMKLEIPVIANGRLKAAHGKFWYNKREKQSARIEISKMYIEHQPWEMVYSTLKHECIHHALFELNKPFKDGDTYFENELKKHGSHSTGTVAYKGRVVVYACTNDGCDTTYERKRRLNHNGKGYTSGCCKASLKCLGEKII